MGDAGRHSVQLDERNAWIATSGKLEHARNYHCSAWDCFSWEYGIGNTEPLPHGATDDESTDSEMNWWSDEAVKAHFGGPFY